MKKKIMMADLFCGAGGTSTGAYKAASKLGIDVDLLAVNHWPVAIKTHTANHQFALHKCESLDGVNPRLVIPGGKLDLLVASPECTHHSNARGGRPKNDQSRASAWHVLRWCEALHIEDVIIENVKEFRQWGPLDENGQAIKSRKGETFNAFVAALESLGYTVEHRILNAADYGDPTTRERLFLRASKQPGPIRWPKQTHSIDGRPGTKKWVAARDIIDWGLESQSIFTRKRPLKPNTINRIVAGLRKFGGPNAEPFLVMLYGTGTARSVDRPMPTVTGGAGRGGGHVGLCEPFVLGQQSGGVARSTGQPLPTIATDGAIGLVQPYLIPFFGERKGQDPRTHSVDEPLPAVTSHGAGGLVQPYLVAVNHPKKTKSKKGDDRSRSVDVPMPALTAKNGLGLVEPFLVKYYGNGGAASLKDPLDTVTGKPHFGLVEFGGKRYKMDIRFRMLQPHELAAAMSFPKDYKFAGTKSDATKQIGNAVAVRLAEALCKSVMSPR